MRAGGTDAINPRLRAGKDARRCPSLRNETKNLKEVNSSFLCFLLYSSLGWNG
jgi:hypothetical protein